MEPDRLKDKKRKKPTGQKKDPMYDPEKKNPMYDEDFDVLSDGKEKKPNIQAEAAEETAQKIRS